MKVELSEHISDDETIKHAAIICEDDKFAVAQRSHAECYEWSRDNHVPVIKRMGAQGFLTSNNRFLGRVDAFLMALEKGMIGDSVEAASAKILFSEDLWSKEHGGKYNYSVDKGYHL